MDTMGSALTLDQQKLQALWDWLIQRGSGRPSALMEEARVALLAACRGPRFDEGTVYDFGQRIARYDSKAGSIPGFVPFVTETVGEWHVTNADLQFWADLCRFAERDLTPEWGLLVHSITDTLHKKRRWQAWQGFLARGGVTDDHRKLLGAMRWNVSMSRGDGVLLYVDGKHPMGDSAREQRMAQVLGWPTPWLGSDEGVPAEVCEKVWDLVDELPFALNAMFSCSAPAAASSGPYQPGQQVLHDLHGVIVLDAPILQSGNWNAHTVDSKRKLIVGENRILRPATRSDTR